jgi:hypothetical protein
MEACLPPYALPATGNERDPPFQIKNISHSAVPPARMNPEIDSEVRIAE